MAKIASGGNRYGPVEPLSAVRSFKFLDLPSCPSSDGLGAAHRKRRRRVPNENPAFELQLCSLQHLRAGGGLAPRQRTCAGTRSLGHHRGGTSVPGADRKPPCGEPHAAFSPCFLSTAWTGMDAGWQPHRARSLLPPLAAADAHTGRRPPPTDSIRPQPPRHLWALLVAKRAARH